MATDQSRPSTAATVEAPGNSRLTRLAASPLARLLGTVILVLLVALLVEVLFEAYVQVQLGPRHKVIENGREVVAIDLPTWPKTLKTALYLALAGLALAKVAIERRWREFTTRADIALVVLGVVMVVAGLAGGSPLALIGKALFVYLRGVIVFYAWRSVNPSWARVKPALWAVGVIIGINALIATVETVIGYDIYEALHWVDYTWARINRAHALLDHPNHLGHVSALMLLGLAAWFVTKRKVGGWWWALFVLVALGMSATQSRESLIGLVAGLGLIWFMRRGGWKVIAPALAIVIAFTALQLAIKPANRAELVRRLAGVMAALHLPSGSEDPTNCVAGNAGCDEEDAIPQREIRVLYAQQGAKLWLHSPLVGYGVGQFGGIVAYTNDKFWYKDTRFGPNGFDMHGFNDGKQVDSFWLHLVVETGTLGFLAYFAWMLLIGLPLWRARVHRRRPGKAAPRGPTSAEGVHPVVYWAAATLLFSLLVAALSTSLEDPILPPLMFSILGVGWVVLGRGETAGVTPVTGLDGPAVPIAAESQGESQGGAQAEPEGGAAVAAEPPLARTASATVSKAVASDQQSSARQRAGAGADAVSRGAYGPVDRES